MIEVTENLLAGINRSATLLFNVVHTDIHEFVENETAINAVEYVLAHTFARADSLDDAKTDLNYIIQLLTTVRDNINPF